MLRVLLLLVPLLGSPTFEELEQAYHESVRDRDWETVKGVAHSIAALRSDRGARFLRDELRGAVADAHRHAVFHAVAFMDAPGIEDFLRENMTSGDPFYRAVSVEALARRNREEGLSRAANMLEADDAPRVRRIAIDILAGYGDATAARALLHAGADLPLPEQLRIVRALKDFPEPALGVAERLLEDSRRDTRLFAALVLLARPAERFRTALTAAREDPDRRVRVVAASALDKLATPGQASFLRRTLAKARSFDSRWELYDLIARAQLRDPVLVQKIAQAATTGPRALRAKAAQTLGAIGGAGAVPTLVRVLRQTEPWQLPIGAARGLAATRSKEAVQPLIDALRKSNGRHAQELSRALESLCGQPFGESADLWQRWWSERGHGF
ncbi:MAG: HEAT repeat domain-containing protein, partial [Planctomycetota bacterium]